MALATTLLRTNLSLRNLSSVKRSFAAGKIIYSKQPSSGGASRGAPANVPGLSSAVVNVPKEPVGPGAAKNTNYKNPEYFSYHNTSYFEAEVEMLQFRLPQPTVKEYYQPSSK